MKKKIEKSEPREASMAIQKLKKKNHFKAYYFNKTKKNVKFEIFRVSSIRT